ncbi:magnesium-translocating P-type ATPase [Rhizobium leguminosarum]|uniref:magnesium-translocating P-type ATPase n=1 Tax=Rhizobium leguminosarum TaxID=384 RepID=UPI00293DF772|nr:magnesium-translocating P-type ATPase [Rhizobium leguminosarum]MDV4160550.1 magnesium-translocating P-type ATPase [Rhizobium leguminosarum]MDV4170279.1 magnesium-translocating P-type ATPase [Rhizobium leguminosarum]
MDIPVLPSPPPSSALEVAIPAYWTRSPSELGAALATSLQDGLTTAQAEERVRRFGPNSLSDESRGGMLADFARQFKSPLVLVLVFAALVAGGVGEVHDAIIIGIIILVSCLLGFLQEHGAQRAVEALRQRISLTSKVRRDGADKVVAAVGIVPGDLILLSAGSLVPVDAVVIVAQDLNVSEATLTGETFPVAKVPGVSTKDAGLADRSNCVFTGTSVRSGTATALAIATGPRTEFARIASAVARQIPETEFARGVRHFGFLMTRIMLCIVVVVLVANLLLHRPIVDSLLFSLALAVGLTPELLPAIISVTLARGARTMSKSGVIVRRLDAMENLGSMDVLCTDKTGTLTEGVIRLDSCVDPQGVVSPEVRRLALLNSAFQSGMKNPLDDAVTATIAAGEISSEARKLAEIPYDFSRKRLSVVVAVRGGPPLLICKGAATNVIDVCAAVMTAGREVALDDNVRKRLDDACRQWGEAGMRALAVATRSISEAAPAISREDESGLCLKGFLLFSDPPKANISAVVASLVERGVRIKVISGDNRYVVQHLASSIGIDGSRMLTGKEVGRMSNDALFSRAGKTDLFVEIDPNQKERIVAALRKAGHVVGYLGDGINDAPALHEADVGISVDGAADVAREAADVVLMRQDLAVLSKGVDDGRRTFTNTMKYISIATSANFGNMISMAAASLVLPFLPLLAKQILLNNLLSDLPAMAIATDKVDPADLRRPQRWDISRIKRFMLWFGPLSSIFDLATFVVLLAVFSAGQDEFRSAWFVESLMTQLATMLVIRTPGPIWRSRPSPLLFGTAIAVGAAGVTIPYTPIGGLFGFVPIPLEILAVLLAVTLIYVSALETVKIFYFATLSTEDHSQPRTSRRRPRTRTRRHSK